jgi:hypothetical protein
VTALSIYKKVFLIKIRSRLIAKKKSWEKLPSLLFVVSEEDLMLAVPPGNFDRIPP